MGNSIPLFIDEVEQPYIFLSGADKQIRNVFITLKGNNHHTINYLLRYVLILILTISLPSLIFSSEVQQDSVYHKLSSFVKNMNTFNHFYPREKVFLHFDNTGYFLGDTIWFNANVVTAERHFPTQLSRVLYVELLSGLGEVLDTKKMKIENGRCHGFFVLSDRYTQTISDLPYGSPDDLEKSKLIEQDYGEFDISKTYHSGFYEVRAYTLGMLNFRDKTNFSRVFPVYNASDDPFQRMMDKPESNSKSLREKTSESKEINVSFYPEGGALIRGLNSRIAFKAIGSYGENISVSGIVYNSLGDSVTSFSTLVQGNGVFDLCSDGGGYTARVYHNGKKYNFLLPESSKDGYSLSLDNSKADNLYVQISKVSGLSTQTLGLVVHCRGRAYLFDTLQIADSAYLKNIPKAVLPSGVNRITLFTSDGEIHAERAFFIPVTNKIQIQLKRSVKLSSFEQVGLDFGLEDSQGNPMPASFSLAIRDGDKEIVTGYNDNLMSHLLLSSDLDGFIENPAYYFESDDTHHTTALDLLMLTQGWRLYEWKQRTSQIPFDVKYYLEDGISVRGKVLSSFRGKPISNQKVMIWTQKEGRSYHGSCITNENGQFSFLFDDSLNVNGKWDLGMQVTDEGKRKSSKIILDRLFSPIPKVYSFYETKVKKIVAADKETDSILVKSLDWMQEIPEVEISQTSGKKRLAIYNIRKEVEDWRERGVNDYPQSVFDYLTKYDPYFWFEGSEIERTGTFRYALGHSLPMSTHGENRWSYGANYSSDLWDKNIEEIEKIVIMRDTKYWNSLLPERGPGVFIYIYPDIKAKKGLRYTSLYGYSYMKDSYHVDYKDKRPVLGEVDYRRTLYWNPEVKTDSNGNVTVSFYNNDSCRKLIIAAEVLTKDGEMGTFHYLVD